MAEEFQNLEKEYDEVFEKYENFCEELSEQLAALFQREGFEEPSLVFEDRVKEWDSIRKNLANKKYSPKNITDINDLVGIRIILLFKRDVDRICEILRQNLTVVEEKNKQNNLLPDQFGYSSIHFIVTLNDSWSAPTLKGFHSLKAEIQVRTSAQHIWANVSHLLSYKNPAQIPDGILRALNRSSALLEVIDNEFSLVLDERAKYLSSIEDSENVELNIESLKALTKRILPAKNREENEDFSQILDEFIHFDIKDTKSLRNVFEKHKNEVLELDKKQATDVLQGLTGSGGPSVFTKLRAAKGVFASHVGLLRSAMFKEFGQPYMDYASANYAKKYSEVESGVEE